MSWCSTTGYKETHLVVDKARVLRGMEVAEVALSNRSGKRHELRLAKYTYRLLGEHRAFGNTLHEEGVVVLYVMTVKACAGDAARSTNAEKEPGKIVGHIEQGCGFPGVVAHPFGRRALWLLPYL